jgi:DNA repair protein RadC
MMEHDAIIQDIKDMPTEERPQYKIRKFGAGALSTPELLAVVCGMKSVNEATAFLSDLVGGIKGLAYYDTLGYESLGLKRNQSEKLDAALELYSRLHSERPAKKVVESASELSDIFMPRLRYERQEHLICLCLNAKCQIMSETTISVGGRSETIAEISLILRPAIVQGAKNIILVHNHPSGNTDPSPQDIELTKNVSVAAEFMDIRLIDHLIIGDGIFYSFRNSDNKDALCMRNTDSTFVKETVHCPARYVPVSRENDSDCISDISAHEEDTLGR